MEKKLLVVYIGSSPTLIDRINSNEGLILNILPNALSAINYFASGHEADAILCESLVLGGGATDIFRTLNKKNLISHIPFILIAFEFRKQEYLEAMKLKIADYYVLPDPETEALISRINFLKKYNAYTKVKATPAEVIPNIKTPLLKRIFDVIFASMALIVLSPLLLVVIIAIKIESKGPFYYISKREGASGKTFNFYKLRSMRKGADSEIKKLQNKKSQYSTFDKPAVVELSFRCPKCQKLSHLGKTCSPILFKSDKEQICEYWNDVQINLITQIKLIGDKDLSIACPRCEELEEKCSDVMNEGNVKMCHDFLEFQDKVVKKLKGTFIKIVDDPRVTKVGKFIRNTSIDELPQLFNVLKGDMSIVGNRPLPTNEAEILKKDSNIKRFLAPAGITGLWQVELRGKGGVMSEKERNDLDNKYADLFINKEYTLLYDIRLIFRTIPALLQKGSV